MGFLSRFFGAPATTATERRHAAVPESYWKDLRRRSPAGLVDGRHYTELVPDLDRLRRDGPAEQYEQLLLACVDATEREARKDRSGPAPAYTQRLAILYEKSGRFQDAIDCLERYEQCPGPGTSNHFAQRLARLRAKRDRPSKEARQ